jgi:hypothetical protein
MYLWKMWNRKKGNFSSSIPIQKAFSRVEGFSRLVEREGDKKRERKFPLSS